MAVVHRTVKVIWSLSRMKFLNQSERTRRYMYTQYLTLSSLSFWNGLFYSCIWTCPLMQRGFSLKSKTEWQTVDPEEYKQSHLDLHCMHRHLFWSGGLKVLTLKTPRKPASENVVCLCRLLNILANFSNLFLHAGKQCGPWSDCSYRSSLIWFHTVCKNDF